MPQIQANGINLEYEIEGPENGPPLLFIAGFGRQLTSLPEEYRKELVKGGIRLIRFDNRDVGLSKKWDGVIPDAKAAAAAMRDGKSPNIPYFLADMAADAAGLLDALGIANAHIAGASMGGMIAQLVALDHPKKARSLISIFSTTGDPSLPRSVPEAQAALVSRPPSNSRADVITHATGTRKLIGSPGYPTDDARMANLIGADFDRSYYPESGPRHFAAIMAGPPRQDRLPSLTLPTLVLHGAEDPLIRPEAGRQTAALIKGSEYHELPGWGHDMPLQLAEKITGLMLDFIRRVEAKR